MPKTLLGNHQAAELLTNKELLQEYEKYAKSTLTLNWTNFLKDYLELKTIYKKYERKSSNAEVQKKMQYIYDEYIAVKSPQELNFSDPDTVDIKVAAKSENGLKFKLFRNMKELAIPLLSKDNYSRFILTSEYGDFKFKEVKQKFRSTVEDIINKLCKFVNENFSEHNNPLLFFYPFKLDEIYMGVQDIKGQLVEIFRDVGKYTLEDIQKNQEKLIQTMSQKYEQASKIKSEKSDKLKEILVEGLKNLGMGNEKLNNLRNIKCSKLEKSQSRSSMPVGGLPPVGGLERLDEKRGSVPLKRMASTKK